VFVDRAQAAYRGIVDQDVDCTVGIERRLHQSIHIGFVGGVALDGNPFAAAFTDHSQCFLKRFGAPAVDDDPRPLAGEGYSDTPAYACPATCDDSDLSIECAHVCPPVGFYP
jgi:hypothetical protein